MAEIDGELMTPESKKERAEQLFNRGHRNYLVKDYSEAAEDLSHCCELYSQVYSFDADELGLPYLLYAKSLIALAQGGENKVLAIEDENENGDSDDEDSGVDEEAENAGTSTKETGNVAKDEAPAEGVSSKVDDGSNNDPQPGTSSGKTNGNGDIPENGTAPEGEEEEDTTNLQYAWEALELAVKIFERKGEVALSNLADACFQLGEISMENSHCEEAIKDYGKRLINDILSFNQRQITLYFLWQVARLRSD